MMEPQKRALAGTARGIMTVARRRGLGFFRYLISGVAWPQAAYRFGWGPSAPPLLRALFAGSAELAAARVDPVELRRLSLLAPEDGSVTVDAPIAADLEQLMERAHAAGIAGVSRSFDRVMRNPEGQLSFADLSAARRYRRGSVGFAAARDEDRRTFNRRFGAALLTEADARRALRKLKANVPPGYRDYAPIDFGGGLTVGRIASTDSGTGRWEFFNRHIVSPIVAGKRVLDLGSNNGSLPLMMLRAGAREIVAVEFTPAIADFARLNARILGWRDMRSYDIQVLTGDMRLFLTRDLGTFDVVTAFCSLYYLPEDDMARIISKAASMKAVLILQSNDAIDNLPAKTVDLHRLMRANGYSNVAVYAPGGFARPLLVGHTPVGTDAREREAALHT